MIGCRGIGSSNRFCQWWFKLWLQAMRRVDVEEDQKNVLYSTHFYSEDFKRDFKLSELQC